MRSKIALTKNVAALQLAFEALSTRDAGVPGMGLVHGYTGAGKTTAIGWMVNKSKGVYVRANSGWTPASMLSKIMHELGSAPLQRRAEMIEWIAQALAAQRRPLFVDEADYVCVGSGAKPMLEALRDLHDLSGIAVVLVGMDGIGKKLAGNAQLTRRISQWVEFLPSDFEDARTLTQTVCEVEIDDELLTQLHRAAEGSIGEMIVGLSRIEALAKGNDWARVSADHWAGRPFFLRQRTAG